MREGWAPLPARAVCLRLAATAVRSLVSLLPLSPPLSLSWCQLFLFHLPPTPHFTMVLMSVLNACLVTLTNAERRGKRQVLIRPVSKVVVKFLQVMMKHGQTTATTQPATSLLTDNRRRAWRAAVLRRCGCDGDRCGGSRTNEQRGAGRSAASLAARRQSFPPNSHPPRIPLLAGQSRFARTLQSLLVHSLRVHERMRIGCVAARCSDHSSGALLESRCPYAGRIR